MNPTDIKQAVQERYGAVARGEQPGCGVTPEQLATTVGYTAEDLAAAGQANLGLGCGNPLALAEIRPGVTVLDLGSGAGFDALLAWRQVGPEGRVIGVDMTPDMLEQARKNARAAGAGNVEFRQGLIEQLPVEDASVDMVISNCVINLSTDKPAVFREIQRVLKPGGRFAVSDIVLLGGLPDAVAQDVAAYVGCIAGASPLSDYIRYAVEAGLADLSVPQIVPGASLASALTPAKAGGCCGSDAQGAASGCCGSGAQDTAAALASVKLHGRKPARA